MCAKSLWGNLKEIEPIKTPKGILEEQGNILTLSTNGTLEGRISVKTYMDLFIVKLHIVVPTMNNYTYEILEVTYPMKLYPLRVNSNFSDRTVECKNEEEYLKTLEIILSSDGVKEIIQVLISQVT